VPSNYRNNEPDKQVSANLSLPSWNTWTNRTVLKGISGVLIALAVFPLLWSWGNAAAYPVLGVLFAAGVVVWCVYYQMEMEYRKVTPDRIR
jgi:hypothetical protein